MKVICQQSLALLINTGVPLICNIKYTHTKKAKNLEHNLEVLYHAYKAIVVSTTWDCISRAKDYQNTENRSVNVWQNILHNKLNLIAIAISNSK